MWWTLPVSVVLYAIVMAGSKLETEEKKKEKQRMKEERKKTKERERRELIDAFLKRADQ
ncbi:hypothetical protein FACS1894205_3330 [Alphaproteobacteria bacterium]|nr:hypothetical protein FACS1894205_3330 [Alphaproteobacteria bacterium]